jgi:hypothetical protein
MNLTSDLCRTMTDLHIVTATISAATFTPGRQVITHNWCAKMVLTTNTASEMMALLANSTVAATPGTITGRPTIFAAAATPGTTTARLATPGMTTA